MAKDKDRKKKDRGEPAIEFRWDPLILAHDKTFSTTIRIEISGWWPEGRPTQVGLSLYEEGQESSPGNAVRIQKGHGTFPLIGLKPGHHYHVVVYIEDRLPVQRMITVPELPKLERPEKEALEGEKVELERAKIARQLREEKPKESRPGEEELENEKIQFARTKLSRDLKDLEPKPKKPEEEALESERLEFQADQVRLERAKVLKELKDLEKKPRVACHDLMVRFSGPRGNQKFVISVSAEDKTLIPHHPIALIDGDKFAGLKTGEDGFAFYETNFQESSRYFEIRAGNSHDLMWRARLLGPGL